MLSRFCCPGGFLSGLRKRRRLLVAVRNWLGALWRSSGTGLRVTAGDLGGFGSRLALGAVLTGAGVAGRLLLMVVVVAGGVMVIGVLLLTRRTTAMLVGVLRLRPGPLQSELHLIFHLHASSSFVADAARDD